MIWRAKFFGSYTEFNTAAQACSCGNDSHL